MATQDKQHQRDSVGFGSTYRKGSKTGAVQDHAIEAVLGGQVWQIKPDKKAQAAHPCLWMQAGVVKFKNCNNYYDCTTCKYDAGMALQVKKGKQISWQDAMKMRPDIDRVCRHSLTGRIAKRSCAYDYECGKCEFDQYFEDVWTPKTGGFPNEIEQIKGFDVPMDHYFHDGHTWARIESGGYVRVGVDDFALKLLGRADAFELPLMGNELDQGQAGWGLRRKDNQADVLSPVNGVIMEVNPRIRETPNVANDEPYGGGWLFVVRPDSIKGTMKPLKANADAIDWTRSEVGHLESMIEETAGPLAADGGLLAADIFGNLPDLGWQNLTRTFLKTG